MPSITSNCYIWPIWTSVPICTATNTGLIIWYEWNLAACNITSTGSPWGYWTNGVTATNITTTYPLAVEAWGQWTNAGGTLYLQPQTWQPCPEPTLEERIAAEEARRIAAERYAAEEKKRRQEAEVARDRAERLLQDHLDAEQRKQYARDKSFRVLGADGATYDIRPGWAGHVSKLGADGKEDERFCIHPREEVPIPDNQLIAKLMLETDPVGFRRIANVTRLRGRAAAPA